MIDVAIVGCGKMGDQHASQIQKINGARIAGVCDSEPLMAQQMAERFSVGRWFTDVQNMLADTRPGVVHITTPPQSHFELGKACLEAGANAYIEKPFTVTTAEADELVRLANQMGRKLTAGHNAQFTQAMTRMREVVRQGFLGGKPVHMESIYGYDLGDNNYAQAFLGDRDHWVRRLPGSLLQNIMSHGVAKIAEFLNGNKAPVVKAFGFTSPFLKKIGQEGVIDEVRAVIQEDDGTTAYFTFSSQMRPALHQFRMYGPESSLIVDDDHQTLIKLSAKEHKSYLRYLVPPFQFAGQYMRSGGVNVMGFVKGAFHLPFETGLRTLIEQFYRAVQGECEAPLSYREILLTARIMDDIIDQIRPDTTR